MKKISGDKLQHEVVKTSQAFYRDQELQIEFGGETAMTNGKTVMIPNVPTDHEFTLDEAAVIRGFVDHEAGHGRHTNFNLAKRSKNIKADIAKYEHYMPITNGIEDVRIERLIVQEYVGAKQTSPIPVPTLTTCISNCMSKTQALLTTSPLSALSLSHGRADVALVTLTQPFRSAWTRYPKTYLRRPSVSWTRLTSVRTRRVRSH